MFFLLLYWKLYGQKKKKRKKKERKKDNNKKRRFFTRQKCRLSPVSLDNSKVAALSVETKAMQRRRETRDCNVLVRTR